MSWPSSGTRLHLFPLQKIAVSLNGVIYDINRIVDPALFPLPMSEDAIRDYLQAIGRTPLLTPDEEIILAQKIQATPWTKLDASTLSPQQHILYQQGLQAKNKLIQANLRFVVSIAKKYQNRGLPLLDLIQEGSIGLDQAAKKFDPTKGFKFSTYAYWWIRQSITHAIALQSRQIRIPRHITQQLSQIYQAQHKFSQAHGRSPTLAELAQRVNLSVSALRKLLLSNQPTCSLNQVINGEDRELGDLLPSQENPETVIEHALELEQLHHLLTQLKPKQAQVIRLRYGLDNGRPRSLAEIANIIGFSRERARQVEAQALHLLRQKQN